MTACIHPKLRAGLVAAALLAAFTRADAVIVITEIMYHPQGGGRDLEYIEIHNETSAPMDLTGYYFSAGIDFTFTERTFLDPGAYLVVCANQDAVKTAYGINNVAGNWDAGTSLDNSGEAIELSNPAGVVEARVRYNDRGKWPSGADGAGHSLEIIDAYLDMDDPDHWALSGVLGGSPGKANDTLTGALPLYLNEGFFPQGAAERWVEIYNAGDTDVDISGYRLTTEASELSQATIPPGTVVPSRRWISIVDASLGLDFTPIGADQRTFIALVNPAGTRVIDARSFEPSQGSSEARIPDGSREFSSVADPTRDAANKITVVQDVVISEILYHPIDRDPQGEFVELYNRGAQPVDLTGCKFSEGIRFAFPSGTILAPDSYLVVAAYPEHIRELYGLPADKVLGPTTPATLDAFGVLADRGERVTLSDARDNVMDTVRYHDGGEWPIWPDGGGSSLELIDPFQDNAVGQAWDSSDESQKVSSKEYSYASTYNGGEAEFHILLCGEGITIVDDIKVATQITTIENIVPFVNANDTVKYFKGRAEPSDPRTRWTELDFDDAAWLEGPMLIGFGDGDEATLLDDMSQNYASFYVRKVFDVADPSTIEELILEIEYDDGYVIYLNGQEVAAGNMNPDARAFDSTARTNKEKAKETLTLTDRKPLLAAGRNILAVQVHNASIRSNDARLAARLMSGRFVTAEGPNLVKDGAFETDAYKPFWTIQGNHDRSGRTTQGPLSGAGSLKLVATGDGDNKVNRIETSNTGFTAPVLKANYNVSFLARWVAGSPTILTHGMYQLSTPASLASSTRIEVPLDAGTPGAVNSATLRQMARTGSRNLGPVISEVRQDPALPAATKPVLVSARVHDPDGIQSVVIHWSLDTPRSVTDAASFTVAMLDPDGDGIYTAEIPGQAARKRVVFHIAATDSSGAEGRFPLDFVNRANPLILDPSAPKVTDHLYVVYRHDTPASSRWQSYRFWMHQANETYLATRPLHSNDMVDGSFLFQNKKIYHNSKIRFSGSPWARQAWTESYRIRFPKDNPLHGSIKSFNMEDHQDGGAVSAKERISHYLLRYNQGITRVPYSLQWLVQLQVNDRVNEPREHVQTPNREFITRWYGGDDDGDFFEMDDRFIINDAGLRQDSQDGRLLYPPYGPVTLGPDKEQYRYFFNTRMNPQLDDYSKLIDLAKVMSPTATPNADYDKAIWDMVDVEEMCRTWAIRQNTDDWDQWGASRGKNCYLYRPALDGRWVLIAWDMELTYSTVSAFLPPTLTATSNPQYGSSFAEVARFWNRPPIKRIFYGVMKEMVDHQFQSTFLAPYVQKLVANGCSNTHVAAKGGFIDQRRNMLLNAVKGVTQPAVGLSVTTNGGAPLTVESQAVAIEGKAPVDICLMSVTVNGSSRIPYELGFSDTDILGWRVDINLPYGTNNLEFTGFNSYEELIDSTTFEVTVVVPLPPVIDLIRPAGVVVGELVTIVGQNFRQGLAVRFGSIDAAEVTFDPGASPDIGAVVPDGVTPGDVEVRVINPGDKESAPYVLRIVAEKRRFVRGDVDLNGALDITDAIATLQALFMGGRQPTCLDAADTNDDGAVNMTDPLVSLLYLFQGGAAPAAPFPDPAQDPTPGDPLDCAVGLE